jgi:hypothetical protein
MWNYRIIRRKDKESGEVYYSLNEVFYNRDGSLMAYSEHDEIIGNTESEIESILEMMISDIKKNRKVLTERDFKKGKKDE